MVILAIVVGLSVGGLPLTRRHVLSRIIFGHEHGHFGGNMIHSIMIFYGLVAALIAVDVWERHNDVAKIVSQEAAAAAALYRDAGAYPDPTRSELQAELRGYIDNVIKEAWPLQKSGQAPAGGVPWFDRMRTTLASYEPTSEGRSLLHAEALRQYNSLIEVSRLRLDAIHDGLPGVMWLVVLLGAAVSLFASFFFQVNDVRLHALFVTLLSLLVGIVLFMIFALDKPYRGDLGVDAEAYQLIYDQLMKP